MARNISRNRISLEGNTVPTSVRLVEFKSGGSVINLTVVTQSDVWSMEGGKMAITGTKPEYHNIVIKGGSKALADILKPKSLFVRVEGELRYRQWSRELKTRDAKGVWSTTYDQSGQPVIVETPQAEIIVAGPKSEFYIFPCVNRQDRAETPQQAQQDAPWQGDGPFAGSESMDQLPF